MSQTKTERKVESSAPKLLIQESPYQFLPSLGHLLGDSEALILQQLHYVLNEKPYFAGESLRRRRWKGRLWIRIEMWMWWDDLEGLCRHLPERTFARKKARLEQFEILLTTKELNRNRDDKTLWWTIDYDTLGNLERDYLEDLERRRAERDQQRELLKRDDPGACWRPNIRIPGLEEPEESYEDMAVGSCHSGMTVSPLIPKASLASCQNGSRLVPEWQDDKCQNGMNENAILASSSNWNKEQTKNREKQQQASATEIQTQAVDDVVEIPLKNGQAPILGAINSENQSLVKSNQRATKHNAAQAAADQGQPLLAGAVLSPVEVPQNGAGTKLHDANLLKQVMTIGVSARAAQKLIAEFPNEVARQLEYWPHHNHAKIPNKGGWFVKAVTDAYSPPPTYIAQEEAKEREESRRAQFEAEQQARDQRRAQIEAEDAQNQELDAEFAALSPDEQKEADAKIIAANPGLELLWQNLDTEGKTRAIGVYRRELLRSGWEPSRSAPRTLSADSPNEQLLAALETVSPEVEATIQAQVLAAFQALGLDEPARESKTWISMRLAEVRKMLKSGRLELPAQLKVA